MQTVQLGQAWKSDTKHQVCRYLPQQRTHMICCFSIETWSPQSRYGHPHTHTKRNQNTNPSQDPAQVLARSPWLSALCRELHTPLAWKAAMLVWLKVLLRKDPKHHVRGEALECCMSKEAPNPSTILNRLQSSIEWLVRTTAWPLRRMSPMTSSFCSQQAETIWNQRNSEVMWD